MYGMQRLIVIDFNPQLVEYLRRHIIENRTHGKGFPYQNQIMQRQVIVKLFGMGPNG
jgi:hypothetical protein